MNKNNNPKLQGEQPSKSLENNNSSENNQSNAIHIPEISLPKGGGALKSLDEKFKVNAANGTSGQSVALPFSPGRNGFTPSVSLSYNSGSGNSAFGLGWSLNLPSIQRKTDKKLPEYKDEDVFLFSGAEDLVPCLEKKGNEWKTKEFTDNTGNYKIKAYRPRITGGFERIEKISHENYGVYWKVTTKENIVILFGRNPKARIADPLNPDKIYKWLPEISYDNKGNWMQYHYKKDSNYNETGELLNDESIPASLFEKNRKSGLAAYTNTYLKKITYGNRYAYYPEKNKPYDPQQLLNTECFFEMVFDYGEHDQLKPFPTETKPWNYRQDAFSTYKQGFEIRTNRLCKRVLMFHHFKDETQFTGTTEEEVFGENYLVRSLDLEYEASSINNSGTTEVTYLKSVSQSGYIRRPGGDYSRKTMAPLEYEYEKLNWNNSIKKVSKENMANAPVGLKNNYQWVDLYNDGIPGMFVEEGQQWYYKSNWGDINNNGEITFSPAKKVMSRPSLSGFGSEVLSIRDLESNGQKQVVVNSTGLKGYFEINDDNEIHPFKSFRQVANTDMHDPNARLIDLNGDGKAEILLTEENVFSWFPADGKNGYLPKEKTYKVLDEEKGPAIVFADQEQTIFLADMSGDGLTDIVRIKNGEICYWANMGYGKFSAKISMANAPVFDTCDSFNPQYIHLADISGTGATDIIYIGKNSFRAYINQSGNAWSNAYENEIFFPVNNHCQLSVIDLLGTGTPCIVWSSDMPCNSETPMSYIDLMNSKQPHVLKLFKNNLGQETEIEYKNSTSYYIKDKLMGRPWVTKLPFPVQVVSKMVVKDKISNASFVTEYNYHHGYFDYDEKEFRGFGMVEQTDTEHYSRKEGEEIQNKDQFSQEPVLTKSWYHTGAFFEKEKILNHYKNEYWHNEYNRKFADSSLEISEPELPDAILSEDVLALRGKDYKEALRACKGMLLRQEVFALDAPGNPTEEQLKLQMKPYVVNTHNCKIQLLQPKAENEHAVFMVSENEALTIEYERDESDYRIAHSINLKIDDLGNVIENASIVYGRDKNKAEADKSLFLNQVTDFSEDVANDSETQKMQLKNALEKNLTLAINEQVKNHITYTKNDFAVFYNGVENVKDIDLPNAYRLRLPSETKVYEITGATTAHKLFTAEELNNTFINATEIDFSEEAGAELQKKLISHIKNKYLGDNLEKLDFGYYDCLALPYESYQLAYTPEMLKNIYIQEDKELTANGKKASGILDSEGKYTKFDNKLWTRSGITYFKHTLGENAENVKKRFYLPVSFEDPFGAVTKVIYDKETFSGNNRNNDGYYLYEKSTIDVLGNKSMLDIFNFRALSPSRMIDINANPASVLLDELCMVKAVASEGNGVFSDSEREKVTLLEKADNLDNLKEYTEAYEVEAIDKLFKSANKSKTNTDELVQQGNKLLKGASSRFIYQFNNYKNTNQPVVAVSIKREDHFVQNNNSNLLFSFEYTNGMGKMAMAKNQAKPGLAYYVENNVRKEKNTGNELRWIGNGRTVLNNKGNTIKQYEPYFSTNFLFENDNELVEFGVTSLNYYDPKGRLMKTENPDGTFSKIEFDSWKKFDYDSNDTVLDSDWYKKRINDAFNAEFIAEGKDPVKEKNAAQNAAQHHNTPHITWMDSLGRDILSIENNGKDSDGKDRLYATLVKLDIGGNLLGVTDARGNKVSSYGYNIQGVKVYRNNIESGERWIVNNISGKPINQWDSREHTFTFTYDISQRVVQIKVAGGDGAEKMDNIYQKIIYGEGAENEYKYNLRGQVHQQYDTSGKIMNYKFDFKGNSLETSRQFCANYKQTPNWIDSNLNDNTLFDSDLGECVVRGEFNALNRAINTTNFDGSITKPFFDETGQLEKVSVKQNDTGEKLYIKNVVYDAKGQRQEIVYADKNGDNLVTTQYTYDKENFALLNMRVTKQNGEVLQDLAYTYDPVGNISFVKDRAIPVKFYNNQKTEGAAAYVYDSLYRLVEAEGREHAGQAEDFGKLDNWQDKGFIKSYSAGDDMAWRNYKQKYAYDPVGNILETKHLASGGNRNRVYEYETENNRLKQTRAGSETYVYTHHNKHGYIQSLPHLHIMERNFKDELSAVAIQLTHDNTEIPEITYYVYDANGQRVRKITENKGGAGKKEERLYMEGIEKYKKYTGTYAGLERISLHVSDGQGYIAMIDTRNDVDDDTDKKTVRFTLKNQSQSSVMELDDSGRIISYEEYHPYGTTAYKAVNANIKVAAKRYRYTGMERDEESGLEYHSARYYISWLGRWLNPDPIDVEAGVNLYRYASCNPVNNIDPNGCEDFSFTKKPKYSLLDGEELTLNVNPYVLTLGADPSAIGGLVANGIVSGLSAYQIGTQDSSSGDTIIGPLTISSTILPTYPIVPINPMSEQGNYYSTGTHSYLTNFPYLSLITFSQYIHSSQRIHFGVPTGSSRSDSYYAFRLGVDRLHIDYGFRTTTVSEDSAFYNMKAVEEQRVGFLSFQIGWLYGAYWNDHAYPFWAGGGEDQGDTAGGSIGYIPFGGIHLRGGWFLKSIMLHFKINTGTPIRGSEAQVGNDLVYQDIIRPDISRGDLYLNALLENDTMVFDVGVGIDSGWLRHYIQSDKVHKPNGIPEFPAENHFGVFGFIKMYFKTEDK